MSAGQTATQGGFLTGLGTTYLIDTVTHSAERPDHVWRLAEIEIVATP